MQTIQEAIQEAANLNAEDESTAYFFALSLIRESLQIETYDWHDLDLDDCQHAIDTVGADHLSAEDVLDELQLLIFHEGRE